MIIGFRKEDANQDIQPNALFHVVPDEPLPGRQGRAIRMNNIIAPDLHPVQVTEHIENRGAKPNHKSVQQPLLPKTEFN